MVVSGKALGDFETGSVSVTGVFRRLQILSNFRAADDPRTFGKHLVASSSSIRDYKMLKEEFDGEQRERGEVDVPERKITSVK